MTMPLGNSRLHHIVVASVLVLKLPVSTDTFPMAKEYGKTGKHNHNNVCKTTKLIQYCLSTPTLVYYVTLTGKINVRYHTTT